MKVSIERLHGPASLQDGGRVGQQHEGLPRGGFADYYSGSLANRLVHHRDEHPLLECTLGLPRLHVNEDCTIAITGAVPDRFEVRSPTGATRSLPTWARTQLRRGETLLGGPCRGGMLAYVAIAGEWKVDRYRWRGSVSPVLYAHQDAQRGRLGKGSVVEVIARCLGGRAYAHPRIPSAPVLLSFQAGPEYGLLARSYAAQQAFATGRWQVEAASNRQGVRLRWPGETYLSMGDNEISNPVAPGTIQLLPDGSLIVAHVDAGTLGGYPRVGFVGREDLDLLAQLRPGQWVGFQA